MDSTQKLIKKALKWGIDVDEGVYLLTIGDMIKVIAEECEIAGKKIETKEELERLIDVAVKGCEHIDWAGPVRNLVWIELEKDEEEDVG